MSENAAPITVTLKSDKGYDAAWAVFHGTADGVREDMLKFFGMDPKAYDGMPACDVAMAADQIFKGNSVVAGVLGGKPIKQDNAWPSSQGQPEWSGVDEDTAQSQEPSVVERVTALLNDAATVDSVKAVWAKNREAFKEHPELLEVYKKRGTELKGAA